MKKRRINRSNIIITCLIVFLIILIIIAGTMAYKIIKETLGGNKTEEVEVLDNIGNYGYQLTENNTEYFTSLYYELKEVLNAPESETFDKDYASLVAQLFVADFYDLNSKLNKTDIGGVQFIYEGYRDTFKKFASDSSGIYYYIENNLYDERKQSLPVVKSVTVNEITNTTYQYKEINDTNAYQVKLYIEYETNLGYPTHATLLLVHNGDKIEVVKVS